LSYENRGQQRISAAIYMIAVDAELHGDGLKAAFPERSRAAGSISQAGDIYTACCLHNH
jgi:hypothetical protein